MTTLSSPDISTNQWLAAAKYRRSVYALKDTSPVPDSRIEEIIQEVISFAPSSYNTQPGRITIVLGQKHKDLWDAVITVAEPILKGAGPGVWDAMGPRFQAFKNAYGSVLFWVSGQAIKEAQETHKAAAHVFEQFSEHTSGMAQILVWTALEIEGFGANLQHMAAIPPAEAAIKKFVGVPDDYSLKANLNFGEPAQPHPEVPAKLPFSETLQVLK
ncbi:Nitroreductase-like protein [Xylogone sp. PMI_703]|nr:Nitroreductase-like protein [Xylogone sp. PMI_703]